MPLLVKSLKIFSGFVGYFLSLLAGVVILSVIDLKASSRDALIVDFVVLIILFSASYLFCILSLKKSPSRSRISILIMLGGVVSIFILKSLFGFSNINESSGVALSAYALVLFLIFHQLRSERTAEVNNLFSVASIMILLSGIVFVEYQYSIFIQAESKIDKAISNEDKYHAPGKCYPSLTNRNTKLLSEYVFELSKMDKQLDSYFPSHLSDEALDKIIEHAARISGAGVESYSYQRKAKDFYNVITIEIKLNGMREKISTFADVMKNDSLIIAQIRQPAYEANDGSEHSIDKYDIAFDTYTYNLDLADLYRSTDSICRLKIDHKPMWPLSVLINNKIDSYTKLCKSKWSDKAYGDMMVYAFYMRYYLINKLSVASVLKESTGQMHLGTKIKILPCPLESDGQQTEPQLNGN